MVKVLFLCLGNICRSPMAEGVFQHKVEAAGLADHIIVDSAGTDDYHEGEMAHSGTRRILKEHGIAYEGRSRPLTRQDFYEYDYILTMDRRNYQTALRRQPEDSTATVKMFLDYADGVATDEVPDPYYTGGFDYVYELVETGAVGLLTTLRGSHDL